MAEKGPKKFSRFMRHFPTTTAVLQHREKQDDTTACECPDGQLVQELLLQESHVGTMF